MRCNLIDNINNNEILLYFFFLTTTISNMFHFFVQLISKSEDDTLGTSISLSVDENSVRTKEGPKVSKKSEPDEKNDNDQKEEQWWLKKPDTCLDVPNVPVEAKTKQSPSISPDVSSSMKEFLEKEKMCKVIETFAFM